MRSAWPLAIAALASVLGACGPKLVDVPVINQIPHTCTEDVSGVVVADPVWTIALKPDGDVVPMEILWPNGFEAMDDGTGLVLVDQDHHVVARPGDHINARGDLLGTGTTHVICGDISVDPR
jgi:hypothetical protein